ncbi:MAG: selenocysteine-specific translation elongation factor [Aminivibrio sp.]|jgi:selenocysteine-specific elongation factor
MEPREISLILGTAGHIDHGKTTLVKALTGHDCDRLGEEKKRGITIELGFAPLALDDGRVASIVDVPGHEKFIRQMVAGASGVDGVLLVVAADEGVMPQTREHLEILRLLGIKDGLIAVTKTDTVEEDFLELVLEDMMEFLEGSFLEGKEMIPVSARTGENLPALKAALSRLVDRIKPRPRKGPFYLPIDRSFPMAGFGAVVTGTAYRGEIGAGMEAAVLPSGKEGRVRSVQVHGTGVKSAMAGQRVAVSVSGISSEDLHRGDVLCAKGIYGATRSFECELSLLENAPGPLRHWQRIRLHIGTSDTVARVALLESALLRPGETRPAQLVAEEEIACLADQRFILRQYSPLVTIGGGRVLFPYGAKPRGKRARKVVADRIRSLATAGGPEERLLALTQSFVVMDLSDGSRYIQETPSDTVRLAEKLKREGKAVFLQGNRKLLLSPEGFKRLADNVESFLHSYHETYPSQQGAPADETALSALKAFEPRTAKAFLEALADSGSVVQTDEGLIRLSSFEPRDDEAFERQSALILSFCREKGFQPPLIAEAREASGLDEKTFSSLLKGMRDTGLVSVVSGEYILSSEVENKLLGILLKEKDGITIARVRDITESSRKFILPLLEYLDAKGYTRRAGDKRVLMASRLPPSVTSS